MFCCKILNLYATRISFITRMIKSRGMTWVDPVTCMVDISKAHRMLVKEKATFEEWAKIGE